MVSDSVENIIVSVVNLCHCTCFTHRKKSFLKFFKTVNILSEQTLLQTFQLLKDSFVVEAQIRSVIYVQNSFLLLLLLDPVYMEWRTPV